MTDQPNVTITLTFDEMCDVGLVVANEVTRLCDLLASGEVPVDEQESTWADRDSMLAISWRMFDALGFKSKESGIKPVQLGRALGHLAVVAVQPTDEPTA